MIAVLLITFLTIAVLFLLCSLKLAQQTDNDNFNQ